MYHGNTIKSHIAQALFTSGSLSFLITLIALYSSITQNLYNHFHPLAGFFLDFYLSRELPIAFFSLLLYIYSFFFITFNLAYPQTTINKMKFSTTALFFSLFAGSMALIVDNEGVKNSPRHLFELVSRAPIPQTGAQGADPAKDKKDPAKQKKKADDAPQVFKDNNGRAVPDGGCCVNGNNLREDICTVRKNAGRCIPAAKTREGCKLQSPPL